MKRLVESGYLKLRGFNNLTKTLNFNLYDFCAARTGSELESYMQYVNDNYDSRKISKIICQVSKTIDATILAVSDQNYDPWGASSMVLLSDSGASFATPSVSAHLDKSHICAHTYPDFKGEVCSFRLDINISTCGEITPLKALNHMLNSVESDVVIVDYLVRGFTRNKDGKRVYLDHEIDSIRDYIEPEALQDYCCYDRCVDEANIWQTRMMRTNMNEQSYFRDDVDLNAPSAKRSLSMIKKEMEGVLYMHS